MPEFTEEQLNEIAEELFERREIAFQKAKTEFMAEVDKPADPVLSTTVPKMSTSQLSPVGQEEVAGEIAKGQHDPIVPPQMTRKVWKQMMRIHFTVRRGLAQPCGHKLATIMVPDEKGKSTVFITSDPRKNCESCWFTYFNTNGQMTQIADDCFQNAGRDVLERSRGKKFVRYFLRFMSTIARFQKESQDAVQRNTEGTESKASELLSTQPQEEAGVGSEVLPTQSETASSPNQGMEESE